MSTTQPIKTTVKPISQDDLLIWPDDSWCYRSELHEMDWKSDDYYVLYIDTPAYNEYLAKEFEHEAALFYWTETVPANAYNGPDSPHGINDLSL